MEFHEVASIFPLMSDEEIQRLADDIKEHGLREAIWLHPDGRIVDGRNRWLACEKAGVQPSFRNWNGEGSLIAFVVSLNLHRRHLDESQRAMVGARIKPMFEDEARARMLATLKQGDEIPARANWPEREQCRRSGGGFPQAQRTRQRLEIG